MAEMNKKTQFGQEVRELYTCNTPGIYPQKVKKNSKAFPKDLVCLGSVMHYQRWVNANVQSCEYSKY